MRKLLVTRGLPGTGKSHTLERLGLADLTLGADALRLLVASPVLTADGRMAITPENEKKVWGTLFELLGRRMARGETVVVDATHPTADTFKEYLRLAREHRYEVGCLDFSEVPRDVGDWGNDGRIEHRVVPQHAVDRISARLAEGTVPDGVRRIVVRRDRSHLDEARRWLEVPVRDLGQDYERVVHVGDVQGCATAMHALLGGGLRDDTFYVFVGDACDRGEENGAVMRWLIDHAVGRPNVAFLWGNHEDHLHREALGLEPVSGEFATRTLPQLREAGVTREELDAFCSRLEDMVLYRFGRHRVMVTHAGLSTVPTAPWMLPARQCAQGTGFYEDDVDSQFERNAPEGWMQVHGHRNHHHRDVRATPRSFNLESAVEHGGTMRGLLLDRDGFRPLEVPNPVFRPFRLRRHHRMTIVPPWMQGEGPADGTVMAPELRAAMEAHPGVRRNPMPDRPHVVNFGFSKKVFYDKSWDDVTVKARGLFVNGRTGQVVSRFADKFWNVDERQDSTMESLKDKLVFPLTLWVKENGYLGLLGYDAETDSLFPSSKSTSGGDFAGWFREILDETVPSAGRKDALRRFLRDTESCMAFEVIDPERDPHIVEYPERKLVLLDVVRRSTDFERLPYEQLEKVGKEFGFEVKKRGISFQNWAAFEGWHRKAMGDMSRQLEGYVVEDSVGQQVKVKLPFYAFWKLARGMCERIVHERLKDKPETARLDPQFLETRGLGHCAELAERFTAWAKAQDTETLQKDIISLRREFLEGPAPEPAGMRM